MANLVITSTTNSVSFLANDYSTSFGWSKRTRLKSSLITITLFPTYVEYLVNTSDKYNVSNAATAGALIVDSIDGVAPSSLDDLYTKMIAVVA
jgi:hypothetical protein